MRLPDEVAERLEGRLTVSVAQAAELLEVSIPTLREAIRRGQVPSLRFGERAVRVPVGALLALCGFTEETEEPAEAGPSEQVVPPLPLRPVNRKAGA